MAARMEMLGLTELEREMDQFSRSMGAAVLRRALTDAARPVRDAAAGAAPQDEGVLRRSIILSTQATGEKGKAAFAREMRASGDRQAAQAALVAARRAAKASGEVPQAAVYLGASLDAPHAHLVEFGTGARQTAAGKFLGSASPQPFLRPAWDAGGAGVIERLAATLRAEIDRTAARVAAKAARAAGR
jgi:HK97 gp10 family phage protein